MRSPLPAYESASSIQLGSGLLWDADTCLLMAPHHPEEGGLFLYVCVDAYMCILMCTRVVCVHVYMGMCMGVVCVYACVHPCGRQRWISGSSSIDLHLVYEFLLHLCVCVHARTYMHAHAFHMWQPEANSQESVLSFHHVGLRNWTRVIRLVGKYLHLSLRLIF